ncbi:GNAT family N-acetyltransferase [Streptomyces sp. NPDC020965]|uniref:GNAT family N-acetyltransferase n=1 Tax=Streptomyces sp. NPDC020965 TaxID=3365105 RepID=UPI00379B36C3
MTTELRVLRPTEWDAWYGTLGLAFGGIAEPDEKQKLIQQLTDYERSLAVWDGADCVATAGTFGFRVTAPGGAAVPMAGVTMVSVAATHRRRGILTSMMRRQLDDIHAWGEPVALLTASEPEIYGRFGYGTASWHLNADIDTTRVRIEAPVGTDDIRIRRVPPVDSMDTIEALYARRVPTRPGMIVRLPGWEKLMLLDSPADHPGASPLQCVFAELDGDVIGYALYRIIPSWENAGPNGAIEVQDLEALTPAANAGLWRYLFGIDLMTRVRMRNRPVDDPWQHFVSDIRRCGLRVIDGLHARLVDVGGALAARTYRTPVEVVLDVEDAFCPWNNGRWRLSGDEKGAVCEPTRAAADLALPVGALASAYLGGTALTALAAAGRVEERTPGALTAAAVAFGSDAAPWVPHNI